MRYLQTKNHLKTKRMFSFHYLQEDFLCNNVLPCWFAIAFAFENITFLNLRGGDISRSRPSMVSRCRGDRRRERGREAERAVRVVILATAVGLLRGRHRRALLRNFAIHF